MFTFSFYPSTKTLKIQGPKQLQYRSQLLKKCSEAKDENLCDTPNLQRSFDATLLQECESTPHCELPCSQETKKIWSAIESLEQRLDNFNNDSLGTSPEVPCQSCAINLTEKEELVERCLKYERRIKELDNENSSLMTVLKMVGEEEKKSRPPSSMASPEHSADSAKDMAWNDAVRSNAKNNDETSNPKSKTDKAKSVNGKVSSSSINVDNQDQAEQKPWNVILGDSMTKNIEGWKLSKEKKVTSRSFSGSTINDMLDFSKPFLRQKPENLILHIGTNDICGESSDNVATKIVRLSKNINKQSPTTKLAISGIIFRTDNENLNTNIKQVNELLKSACKNNGWKFISNHNIRKDLLNRSGLHLNHKGVALLASNFKLALNSF